MESNENPSQKYDDIPEQQAFFFECVINTIQYEGMDKKQIYYNFKKNYNDDITSWNSPKTYHEVITLKLPKNIRAKNIKKIEFLNSTESKTSWGDSAYYAVNIKNALENLDFKDYASNTFSCDFGTLSKNSKKDFWIMDEKIKEGAVLITKQCVFFNWFTFLGTEDYVQIAYSQQAEKFGSSSGGGMWIGLGSKIRLIF